MTTRVTTLVLSVLLSGALACGTTAERRLRQDSGVVTTPTPLPGTPTPVPADQAATPVFTHPSGVYPTAISVGVSTATAGAHIRCEFGNLYPTFGSPLYLEPIRVSESGALRCRAYHDTMYPSEVGEAIYIIDGGGNGGELPEYAGATIEVEFAVEGVEALWVVDGIMDVVHKSGHAPEDPIVRITPHGGFEHEVNPWVLAPYHAEEGISCSWGGAPSNLCVSRPLDLALPEFVHGSTGFIPASSLRVYVGRGSVTVAEESRVVVNDAPSGWSGYWFAFDYWYEKPTP